MRSTNRAGTRKSAARVFGSYQHSHSVEDMMAATSFLPNDAYSYSTQPQLNNSTEEEDSFCVEDNVTECAGYLSLVSFCVLPHVTLLTHACSLFC